LGKYWSTWAIFTTIAIIITLFIFYRLGIYRRYWHYASVEEMLLLIGAVTVSVTAGGLVCMMLRILLVPGFAQLPLAVPLVFFLLVLMLTAGPRLALRMVVFYQRRSWPTGINFGSRILIMGAGQAGSMIAREIQNNPRLGVVAGFLDDDPSKHHLTIRGVPVFGCRQDLKAVVKENDIEQLIIAMPAVSGKIIGEIVKKCEHIGLQTKIMPGIYELLDGTVSFNQLRNVQIEDLLRREPVKTDLAAVQKLIRGKRILVTGGGGSIGSELCRQLLRFEPGELVLVGHGENSIFNICNELSKILDSRYPATTSADEKGWRLNEGRKTEFGAGKPLKPCRLTPCIADIRDVVRLGSVFEKHRPDIVFHAAAHKHVPLVEANMLEGVRNNVLGTLALAQAAFYGGVETFVLISTDKAVRPTNVMGATKRWAELIVQEVARRASAQATGQHFCAVRFGNVLGSSGSVIPLFKEQIAYGGPVTVTHAEVTRYFMSIHEAVELVIQTGSLTRGGEVFLLNMGEPVKIIDLARNMIRLAGYSVCDANNPEGDIEIAITGLRPGEKLYEELLIAGSNAEGTPHPKIMMVNEPCLDAIALAWQIERLKDSIEAWDEVAVREILMGVAASGSAKQEMTCPA
jgi:FlaA1/EpsC-like NDP-sugar epimerase